MNQVKKIKTTKNFEFYSVSTDSNYQIPLIPSMVSAGFPSPADDYLDVPIDLNEHLVENVAATFYIRVIGNSMIDEGINDGDLLIVDRSKNPKNNDIVIGILNGEFTVKKIEKACVDIGFFQVVGHGINLNKINKICKIGHTFFNSPNSNKIKLAPKKWNKKNKNLYRGYFPSDVNVKEGLDIGDLQVSNNYAKKTKNQYIEYLNLNKSFNKNSLNLLSDYFDEI